MYYNTTVVEWWYREAGYTTRKIESRQVIKVDV